MRILQAHNSYRFPGGEDRVVADEARLLRSYGHQVERFEVKNSADLLEAAKALSLSIWNPASLVRLERTIREFKADVLHVHNTWFSLSPSVLSNRDVPTQLTLHNYRTVCANAQLFRNGNVCELCVDGSTFNAVRYGCYRDRLASIPAAATVGVHRRLGTWRRLPDHVLVLTDFAKKYAVAAGFPEERISVHSNFVFDPGPIGTPPAASDYICFVGRLDVSKGIEVLAQAWQQAPPSLRLVVVGSGPMEHLIEKLPRTKVTGWIPAAEVTQILGNSRAFVLPSLWYEGQPIALLEALALRRPVIASNHGGIGETAAGLGPDSLVSPGSVAELANAIERLISDDEVAKRGAKSRDLYELKHSPHVAFGSLSKAYHRTIELFGQRVRT